jgi:hypothetical protein
LEDIDRVERGGDAGAKVGLGRILVSTTLR